MFTCFDCETELDQLDTIVRGSDGSFLYHVYICHNEECDHYGQLYNDRGSELSEGDPSGLY